MLTVHFWILWSVLILLMYESCIELVASIEPFALTTQVLALTIVRPLPMACGLVIEVVLEHFGDYSLQL